MFCGCSLRGSVLSIILPFVSGTEKSHCSTSHNMVFATYIHLVFSFGSSSSAHRSLTDILFHLLTFANNAETKQRRLQFLKSIHPGCFANFLLVSLPNHPTCCFLPWSAALLRGCPSPPALMTPAPYLKQPLRVTQCEMSSSHPML